VEFAAGSPFFGMPRACPVVPHARHLQLAGGGGAAGGGRCADGDSAGGDDRAIAEAVKVHGKGGYVDTWLFQSMLARQRGNHDQAERLVERVEDWRRKQTFAAWQQRAFWDALLGQARKHISTPPVMPAVAQGE
jgi:hypothetical protein